MQHLIKRPFVFIGIIVLQSLCALFFLIDVTSDMMGRDSSIVHLVVESAATFGFICAIMIEISYMLSIERRQRQLEENLNQASQAFFDVIDAQLREWNLTPSEYDVTILMVKGLSIAEIAQIRGSKEGTVKAQLNAIYRKAGSENRSELLSNIIDRLILTQPEAALGTDK